MNEISSISDYLNILKAVVKENSDHEYFFKGHADKQLEILPAIYQNPQLNIVFHK